MVVAAQRLHLRRSAHQPRSADATYLWAYGRVIRCDELIEDGPPPPQMGMRPREVRIYDGWLGSSDALARAIRRPPTRATHLSSELAYLRCELFLSSARHCRIALQPRL